MQTPGSLIKGLIRRWLPQPSPEGPESEGYVRLGRYQEPSMLSMVRKAHLLADEGSAFVGNNAQTGIIEGVQNAFLATGPTLIIANLEDQTNPAAKSIFVDYIDLCVSAAGVTASAVTAKWFALLKDKGNRYSSGGTDITSKFAPLNSLTGALPKFKAYFGALTAAAASGGVQTVVGQRLARLPVTATTAPDALGDRLRLESGNVESEVPVQLGTTAALMANVMQNVQKVPPLVIEPGYCLLLYTWTQCTTYSTGTTWLPEIGCWAR